MKILSLRMQHSLPNKISIYLSFYRTLKRHAVPRTWNEVPGLSRAQSMYVQSYGVLVGIINYIAMFV